MQIIKTIYKCDGCKRKLPEPHLSITFGNGYSGWVFFVLGMGWKHSKSCIKSKGIYQFCDGRCLERFFK